MILKKRSGRETDTLAIAVDHNSSEIKPSVVVNASKLMGCSDVSLFRREEMSVLLKHFQ